MTYKLNIKLNICLILALYFYVFVLVMPSHVHINIDKHKNCTGHMSGTNMEEHYCVICSIGLNSTVLPSIISDIKINSYDFKYTHTKEQTCKNLFGTYYSPRGPPSLI